MPRAPKKYYAVRIGREGPKIYETWPECSANVSRWPGAIHKSFTCRTAAEEWLKSSTSITTHPSSVSAPPADSTGGSRSSRFNPLDVTPQPSPKPQPNPQGDDSFSHQADFIPLQADFDPLKADKPKSTRPDVVLSQEQRMVLQMVQRGENVFFTGSAGTGKSVLLREIIRLHEDMDSKNIAITASTGIASVNIGGTTLHSWAGIGLGQDAARNLAGKFLGQEKFRNVRDRWRNVGTLVLDEISMIDGVLFDKLEFIARIVRGNDKPFGGIQLVLSGDFCQLPPVPDRKGGIAIPSVFAFDAESWSRCIKRPIILSKVFRQKDQDFVDMLNAMRFGQLEEQTIQAFKKLSRPVVYHDGIGPTQLFPTRREVDTANKRRLDQLPGALISYRATDCPGRDANGQLVGVDQMKRLLERLVVPFMVDLKVGAQVMLVKNLVQGHLVNGSVGTVLKFSTAREAAQDATEIGTEEGAKDSKEGSKEILRSDDRWPVVRFTNGRQLLCVPADFTVNRADGEMEARRRQVPLILAWALSIHKSQGQTLERVKVDLGQIFEKGQAYVALSRATNMQTLEILNFRPEKVMAHPRVLTWHDEIEREGNSGRIEDIDMDDEDAREAYWN